MPGRARLPILVPADLERLRPFLTLKLSEIDGALATLYQGTGSPEGSVAAPIGSIYLRTDGAAGATIYVKETGTGKTGWTALGGAPAIPTLSRIVSCGVI